MSTENENLNEIADAVTDGATDAEQALDSAELPGADADLNLADGVEETLAQDTGSFELPEEMPSFDDTPTSLTPEEAAEEIAAEQVNVPATGEIMPVENDENSDDVESTAVRRRSLFAGEEGEDAPAEEAAPATEVAAPIEEPVAEPPATTQPEAAEEKPVWSPVSKENAETDKNLDDVLLAGSTVVGKPRSRAGAHWAGILLSLVCFPFAWFLVHEGASFLTSGDATVWPAQVSIRGAVEFGVGALLFAIAVFAARRSSVGAFLVGIITLAIGIPFVAVPSQLAEYVSPFFERLQTHSTLGENLVKYVMADGLTGRFLLLGLLMLMVGVVSHSARRAGRREQEIVDRVRRV